jgi:hypothetical protein
LVKKRKEEGEGRGKEEKEKEESILNLMLISHPISICFPLSKMELLYYFFEGKQQA